MPLLSLSAGWQPASMAASVGESPVPTKLLSLGDDINPTAWMNLRDDAPQAQVRMVADAQPEAAIRPYRALAAAVISTAISELARCARKAMSGALHQLETLTSGPWWHVWCSTVGIDAEDLGAALEKRLARGEAHTLPRGYVQVEAERAAAD
jgi:hypothetical protein